MDVDSPPIDLPQVAEPTVPYPSRFWWLMRLGAVGCAIVLLGLAVRWWWGDLAQRRIDAAIAAAHARGEPILVSDYAAESHPPDEANAAFFLRRAAMALKYTRTEEWALGNAQGPLRADIAQVAAATVRKYRPQLADIFEARRHANTVDWALPIRSPMWSVLLRDLNHLSELRMLAHAAALLAAQEGDYREALEQVRNMRFCAEAAETQPFLVAQQSMMHGHRWALSTLADIAVDMPLDDPKVREELRAMIPILLDERRQTKALQDGMRGDRAMHLDAGMVLSARYPVLRPALQLDTLRLLAQDDAMVAASNAPTWPAAKTAFPVRPRYTGSKHHARFVGNLFPNAWDDKNLLRHAQLKAHGRLVATMLAIRLYQHDHAGQRPPTLDALVPQYLPAVPRDPLAAADQPIRYLPQGARPYVYGVGEDGVDDSAIGWRPSSADLVPTAATDGFVDLVRHSIQRPVTRARPPKARKRWSRSSVTDDSVDHLSPDPALAEIMRRDDCRSRHPPPV